MHRVLRKVGAVLLLAAGTVMLVSGWRGFAQSEPLEAIPEEPQIRFCAPTIGEIAEEFGVWVALRQLGCLGVAVVGTLFASGSALYLMPKKRSMTTNRPSQ